MSDIVKIAIDAMGGDGSPKKVIDGILHHHKNDKETFYQIFGNKDQITKLIPSSFKNNFFKVCVFI